MAPGTSNVSKELKKIAPGAFNVSKELKKVAPGASDVSKELKIVAPGASNVSKELKKIAPGVSKVLHGAPKIVPRSTRLEQFRGIPEFLFLFLQTDLLEEINFYSLLRVLLFILHNIYMLCAIIDTV